MLVAKDITARPCLLQLSLGFLFHNVHVFTLHGFVFYFQDLILNKIKKPSLLQSNYANCLLLELY